MSSNIEDVNSSGQETGGASAGQKAGQAVNSAKKVGKAAKNIQKQVANARKNAIIAKLIGFLWPVVLIIILTILLIGVLTAIRSIPGMMMDKIVETGKGLWTGFKNRIQNKLLFRRRNAPGRNMRMYYRIVAGTGNGIRLLRPSRQRT